MKSYADHMDRNKIKESILLNKVIDDFEDKGGDKINPAILVSGAIAVLSGFTVKHPWLVGPATMMSGSASLIGNSLKESPPGSNGGGPLADRLLEQFDKQYDMLTNAKDAVFGVDDADPDKDIPKEMLKQTFENPSVRALGDGQWLMANPTEGLEEYMGHMHDRMVSFAAKQVAKTL